MDEFPPFLVPTEIETSRLVLRLFRDDDWPAMHELYSDPDCVEFTFGQPLSERESWRAMASMAGHWLLRGYGPYAIERREDGVVLGTAGLWYPNDWPEPEIKWALVRRYWGRGIASESARAIQRMAWSHLPETELISLIDRENSRSIRLASALGATSEEEIPFRGGLWHVYRHPGKPS